MKAKSYALIGYACGVGGSVPGAHEGPVAIRSLKLANRITALGHSVVDFGDVKTPDAQTSRLPELDGQLSEAEKKTQNPAVVYTACRKLYELTRRALEERLSPIILGGDHSVSIGSVAAVSDHFREQGKKIGLIWIDTHPDLNTPETSYSGKLYGMSVAVLTGRIPGLLQSIQGHQPAVDLKNVAYIGLRDVDPPEKQFIRQQKITAFSTKEIDMHGIRKAIEVAIETACRDTCGFVASFDLDVLDPDLVPGTGFPFRGGLTAREAHLILEMLHDSEKMLAFEMVELNPNLDRESRTAEMGAWLIESAVGKSIL